MKPWDVEIIDVFNKNLFLSCFLPQPTNTAQSDDTMSEDDSEDIPQLPRASSWPTEASSSRVRVNREEKQVQSGAIYIVSSDCCLFTEKMIGVNVITVCVPLGGGGGGEGGERGKKEVRGQRGGEMKERRERKEKGK